MEHYFLSGIAFFSLNIHFLSWHKDWLYSSKKKEGSEMLGYVLLKIIEEITSLVYPHLDMQSKEEFAKIMGRLDDMAHELISENN